jgi:hypothetical protein
MAGKMHHQTVDLVAPENYSSALKGKVGAFSSTDRLTIGFPASPILKKKYDPKSIFVDLVLDSSVNDDPETESIALGHWGLDSSYKRDYFIEDGGDSVSAPFVSDVEASANGGPGSPYTPNLVSSNEGGIGMGTGQATVVDATSSKTSRAPFVGSSADTNASQPATTSKIHRATTLNSFGVVPGIMPGGVPGSNLLEPPGPKS